VLLYFVQNPGKVVTRDELLKNVWAETFVDENSLAAMPQSRPSRGQHMPY
jgi:DNA-binding winged helix-turn-helix (wHTH) protein